MSPLEVNKTKAYESWVPKLPWVELQVGFDGCVCT
jgi:hypothetical protein